MSPEQRARVEDSLNLAHQMRDEWATVMASDLRALLDANDALSRPAPDAGTHMVALIAAVNDILSSFDPEQFADPINWGDLRCVSAVAGVEYGPDGDADPVLAVVIQEAGPDCPALSAAVSDALAARGFPGVTVRTEW